MILTLVNQKGGVGKTTNTIHLGAKLAELGYNVLLIDMDPQCDLSHGTFVRTNTYDIIDFISGDDSFRIKKRADNFFILPGNKNFIPSLYKRKALKRRLDKISSHFDFIIMDCPPENINPVVVTAPELALIACDAFIIPLEANEYPIKNANDFLGKALAIKEKYNNDLNFLGFFFSSVLVTKRNISEYSKLLKKHSKGLLFNTFIRTDTLVEQAIKQGKTIFQFSPGCRAAEDYTNFTKEFLKRVK